jgi:hypothetical protein
MSELTQEMQAHDDGKPWGFMVGEAFVLLPKVPLLMAHLGPPPFDVTMPSEAVRRIVHEPVAEAPA